MSLSTEVLIPSTDVQMAEHPNVGRNGFVDCSNLVVSRTDSFLYPRRSFTRIQIEESEVARDVNWDLLEISMLGCNGSEYRDGPCDGLQSSVRNHISKFCRL